MSSEVDRKKVKAVLPYLRKATTAFFYRLRFRQGAQPLLRFRYDQTGLQSPATTPQQVIKGIYFTFKKGILRSTHIASLYK